MASRRRAKAQEILSEDDDAIQNEDLKTSKRRTSSRTAKTKAPPPEPVLPTPGRVTRSRSRSVLRDTVTIASSDVTSRVTTPGPVSRVPRLDVQSEDEEEAAADPGQVTVLESGQQESSSTPLPSWTASLKLPSFPSWSPALKLPKESRGMLVASLVLLLLLLLITKVVALLHQGQGASEAAVLVLAYALAPLRLTVEAGRLLGGAVLGQQQQPRPVPHQSLDYDVLVDNILNSDKLYRVIERVSTAKVSDHVQKYEESIKNDLDKNQAKVIQAEVTKIDNRIEEAKLTFQKDIEEAMASIQRDISRNTQYENSQKEMLGVLETQIAEFKTQMDELTANIATTGAKNEENVLAELRQMRENVQILEEGRRVTAAEIQKCCRTNNDINLVIEDKMSGLAEQLKKELDKKLVSKDDLNQRIQNLETDTQDKLVTYTSSVKEETKVDIEKLVNSKIVELKNSLDMDTLFPVSPAPEVNVSTPVREMDKVDRNSVDKVDVRKIVHEALTKYDADKTGLFDFALETAGGSVVTTKCTEPYQLTSAVMSVWGIPFWWDTNSPRTILQPGTSPGQCWAFRGSHGVIVVQLSASIHITAVTIEHISSLLSPDGNIYSAPSHLSLAGVPEDAVSAAVTPLLNFTYSAAGDPVQTFVLDSATEQRWRLVELTIHNNHGHPDYTCLYRFRVHGNVSQDSNGKKH